MALASPNVPSNVTTPARTHAQEIAELKAKLAEIASISNRVTQLEKKVG